MKAKDGFNKLASSTYDDKPRKPDSRAKKGSGYHGCYTETGVDFLTGPLVLGAHQAFIP